MNSAPPVDEAGDPPSIRVAVSDAVPLAEPELIRVAYTDTRMSSPEPVPLLYGLRCEDVDSPFGRSRTGLACSSMFAVTTENTSTSSPGSNGIAAPEVTLNDDPFDVSLPELL